MNNGFMKLEAFDGSGRADFHLTHHHQTVDLRVQRTQAVRQFFRQHRNDFTWKIHRGATDHRFTVDGRVFLYIMGYIGNRHEQTKTGCARFTINRIIKVACIRAVDGHKRFLAQVKTTDLIFLFNLGRYALYFFQ